MAAAPSRVPLLATCAVYLYAEGTAPGTFGPQTVSIGLMVAVYTAAVHLAGRRAWAVGTLSLVLMWIGYVAGPEGDIADFWPRGSGPGARPHRARAA